MSLKAGEVYYEVHAKTDKARSDLDTFESQVKGSGGGFSALREIATGALRKIGEAFVDVAGKAVQFGASVVQVGQQFEAQMDKVAAISGATGDDVDSLTAKAEEMGAKTKFTATEAGQAFEYMAMAGWKTEAMLEGIEPILNLATAAGEDLGTTSDIVTDALTAFGLTAEDTAHFADVLAAASSNANTNVSMMGETFKYAAPIAGSMGYSIEDTAEAIGILANNGIKGSQAGTTLRQVMTKLNGEVKITGDAIGEVSIQTTNADGSMRDFNDILDDCRGAFSKLSDSEKVNAAQTLVGRNAMSGFLALMNAAPEDVNKLREAIGDCTGATQTMADTMNDNLQGQITILQSALDGLRLTLYKDIEGPLTNLARNAQGWVNQITDGFKEGGITGMFEAAGEIIDSLIEGFLEKWPEIAETGMDMLFNFMEGAISGVPDAVGRLGEFFEPLISGFFERFPELFSTGAEMLRSMASGFAESIPEFLSQALPMLLDFTSNLRENFGLFVDAGIDFIVNLVQGIINGLPQLLNYIPTIISNVAGLINDNLPKLFRAGIDMVVNIFKGLWEHRHEIINAFPKIIKAIWDVFTAINWLDLGRKVITGIWNGIKNLAHSIPETFREIIRNAWNAFKTTDWWSVGKNVIDGIVGGIKAVPGAIKDAVMGLARSAWQGVKNFFGIKSPSKLMRDTVGQPIGEGMALGIEDSEEDVNEAMRGLSEAAFGSISADVDYNLPDLSDMAQDLGASFAYSGQTELTVPLYLDGREIARGTAYYMGQQLSWEG